MTPKKKQPRVTRAEKQIEKLVMPVTSELLTAKAIDKSNRIINLAEFNRILDKKIALLDKMLEKYEVNGVRLDKDKVAAIYAGLDYLNDMRHLHKGFTMETNKKTGFINGIKKLFQGPKSAKTNQNSRNGR